MNYGSDVSWTKWRALKIYVMSENLSLGQILGSLNPQFLVQTGSGSKLAQNFEIQALEFGLDEWGPCGYFPCLIPFLN